ncbi:helix-turn-helix domain-containing protein [Paenarthrobacter nicotinovorans]|uniref:helix-turn-helix domain-containing protein n=1 Tax=Paenarthrobacter nicotinovorans TaxID=29320 RepID=UPI0009ED6D94
MSVESLAIVLHHSKATPTDKLVLVGIANHDGDAGAWPSMATLAKYTNMSTRTVQRSIQKLVRAGELLVDIQDGGDRRLPDHRRPNRYTITLKCPPNCDRSTKHKLVDNFNQRELFPVDRAPSGRVTPLSPGDTTVRGGGDTTVTPPGDTTVTQTIIKNHTMNHPEKPGTSPAKPARCWACGKLDPTVQRSYCGPCSSRGLNNPMISCHCGLRAQKRRHPGQTHFFCEECPPLADVRQGEP